MGYLGKTLAECQQGMTHRQYVALLEYLNYRDGQPSPSDWYSMQISAEVRRVLSKRPNDIKISDFRLIRDDGKKKPVVEETAEQHAARSKSAWFAMLGIATPVLPQEEVTDERLGTSNGR